MANEISLRHSATGENLYFTVRSLACTYWNGSSLETLVVAYWANYDIALSESPASSYFFTGDWPSGLSTAGWYWLDIFKRAGGSPAIGDAIQASYFGYWDGTTFKFWGEDTIQIGGTGQTARDIGAAVPNAAPGANGGLPTVDANNNVHGVQPGTGTGQLNPSGGKMPATIAAGDLATDSITAAAVKADAVTKIQNGLATSAEVATVAGYIDTEIAAILSAVDTEVAAIKAKTDQLSFISDRVRSIAF